MGSTCSSVALPTRSLRQCEVVVKRPVLFLGGVPGSGKSHLGEQLRAVVPNLRHEGAGQLIRRGLGGTDTEYRRPPVHDAAAADYFQDVLVEAFGRVRSEHGGPIALDGHFAVPTESGPSLVGAPVFRRLGITHILLLDVPVEVVVQ